METRKPQLLLHPLFILSLACLLINDLYWKYEYHNWLTGKLSDFAGLFVLSVFLSAFFFRHRSFVYVGVAIFFIWWKSPLSQPLLDLLNTSFTFSFDRTTDYSDYIAIPVVFAASLLKHPVYNPSFLKQVATYFISAVCLFSFCSTSIIRKFMIAPELGGRITYNDSYETRYSTEMILSKLDSLQFNYKLDSFTIAPLRFYGGSLIIKERDSIERDLVVLNSDTSRTKAYFRIDERPYVAIYDLRVNDEVIPQVNINIHTYVRSSTIYLRDIILTDEQLSEYYEKRTKTKKKFRKLIEEGLIRRLR